MGTIMQSVKVTRIKDGKDGPPGADAVMYSIEVSPSAWCLNADGTVPFESLYLDFPKVKVYKTEGAVREDVTKQTNGTARILELRMIADGTEVSSRLVWVNTDADYHYRLRPVNSEGLGYRSVRLELREGETLWASADCSISQAGDIGGLRAPTRWTNWDTDPTGMQFYSGDSVDDLFTDMVYICRTNADGTTTTAFGKCVRNFRRESGDAGQHFFSVMREGRSCFTAFSKADFLATDILWALVGKIGEFIFENGQMKSQGRDHDNVPNVMLDGLVGSIWVAGGVVNPFRRINADNLAGYLTLEEDGNFWFDLSKSGTKLLFEKTLTDDLIAGVIRDMGGDSSGGLAFMLPSGKQYSGIEVEIYNLGQATILVTGRVSTTSWDDFGHLSSDGTQSIRIMPYTYCRLVYMPVNHANHLNWSSGDSETGVHYRWIIREEKKL